MAEINAFNIRVYALFINDNNEILLADENRFGMNMTKFPGGGLKFGEGSIDCLKREILEELGLEIEIIRHFYTTDYFQKALFYDDQQLISIYYLARFMNAPEDIADAQFTDLRRDAGEVITFRYRSIIDASDHELSFPIDKKVIKLLKQEI